MLRERGAPWATMPRTIENASMLGVTPTRIEFNAVEGRARADLVHDDAQVLYEYLQRINEGSGARRRSIAPDRHRLEQHAHRPVDKALTYVGLPDGSRENRKLQ